MGLFSSLFGTKEETIEESRAKLYKQLPHIGLRVMATKAYDEIWKAGKARGDADQLCHEAACINVFIRRYEAEPGRRTLSISEMAEAVRFEAIPFNILHPREGEKALIEYLVWREYPNHADMKVLTAAISNLVSHLQQNDGDEFLDGLRSETFRWISWTKLLT